MLLIFGLILQLIGGFLLSIEALGIKEYIEYRNDGNDVHYRRANLWLDATFNNISVFLFVNILWLLILLYIFKLPLKASLLLFLIGYSIYKLIIYLLEQLTRLIDKLSLKLPDKAGCIITIILSLYNIVVALVYGAIMFIKIIIKFVLDIPIRYFSEKVISRCILYIFIKIYNLLQETKSDVFKKPIFIGALFIILGFIYQLLGTLLTK